MTSSTPALSTKESVLWAIRRATQDHLGVTAEALEVGVLVGSQAALVLAVETYAARLGYALPLLWVARIAMLATLLLLVDTALEWRRDIAPRAERWQTACPSHGHRPSSSHAVTSAPSLPMPTSAPAMSVSERRQQLFKRFATVAADAPLDDVPGSPTLLGKERAAALPTDWDHVRVPLSAFLWLRLFIWAPLAFHFFFGSLPGTRPGRGSRGVLRYAAEYALTARRLWPWPHAVDHARLFASLLLNTGLAMFITPESLGADFAARPAPRRVTVCLPQAVSVVAPDTPGGVASAHYAELRAEVDVDGGRLVDATYGGEALSDADALACLWLNLLTHTHTQVRAGGRAGIVPTAA